MKRGWIYLGGLMLGMLSMPAWSAERQTVCAHYAANYGWSKGYKVDALVEDGSELNQATGTFNYQSYAKYVVIFWDEGQASIIKLRFGYLSTIDTEGEDQRGKSWKVSTSDFCM